MPDSTRVATVYPPGYETWGEKFQRKFKENPWVPLGCLATCGALLMSAVKMRQGRSKEMNYWMRARVGLQGLTLVALVAGSMALKAAKEKAELEAANAPELTQEQIRQLEKEKEEFEMRLKEAEYSHAQEMALAAGANVRKAKTAEAAQKSAAVGVEVDTENRPSTPAPSGKSWWKMW